MSRAFLAVLMALMACGGGELTTLEDGATSDDASLVAAPACSAAKMAEIVAPATSTSGSVQIACTAKLTTSGVRITKKVYFSGPAASGASLDCNGGSIGLVDQGSALVNVRSVKNAAGVWERPENVAVRNCTIEGSVVITGLDAPTLLAESEKPGLTAYAQQVSPKGVLLDHLVINTRQGSALYIAQGTNVTLSNSELKRVAAVVNNTDVSGSAIYLNHETSGHRIINNFIHVSQGERTWTEILLGSDHRREQIAIDGSANNLIANNRFASLNTGGIFLYRNCGETSPGTTRGTIRHQTPNHNAIINNTFEYKSYTGSTPAVWLGSRAGNRSYCDGDKGFPFGSSVSDLDWATENVVAQNQFIGREPLIRDDEGANAALNLVTGNQTVSARIVRPAGCVVDEGTSFRFVEAGVKVGSAVCAGTTLTAAPRVLDLKRYFLTKVGHEAGTDRLPTWHGTPYTLEFTMGHLFSQREALGTWAPLYSCVNNSNDTDRYVSRSVECEHAGYAERLLGYVPLSLPAGAPATRPLYRCHLGSGHFVTTSSTCEGSQATNEGVIAQLFTAPPAWP